MLSPAPSIPLHPSAPDQRPRAWADCPRCGEHWPAGSPYCINCGWTPDSHGAMAGAAASTHAGRRLAWPIVAAAGLVMVLSLLLWDWTDGRDAAAPPAPGPGPATGTGMAQTPAPAHTSDPASAAEPWVGAAAPASAPAPANAAPGPGIPSQVARQPAAPSPAAHAPPDRAPAGPDAARQARPFVQDWLAAEAGAAGDPSALRDFYADQVAYRGRAAADWAVIAADKAGFMQRWPGRRYELLSVHALDDGADGRWQAALHVRWQLQNRGRWRRGESVTLLTLRWIDGHWRIVAESAAGATPRPAPPA